ncbi:helix-turn-helix domain-containing protein [Salimicrobium halophilum]|uniref:Two-component system, response regulator YesN n=1 Tax=Salimicrobium halophilum TaxID=86666 RepID=A0A1G8T6V9_9BACI|nr:helix-turn-helix domain-containing protein [Salimicrobium halophilum]SDJ37286.1 two-component system, response regulator YesN [Salimicrobium halophilum]
MYKVALVDDDVMVLRYMQKMIPWEEHGFEVTGVFNDSVEAYNELKMNNYDVLFTDIGMPNLNGIELISLLYEENPDLYKVILSCHDEFLYAQQALKLEAFDYILKESMEEETIVDLLKSLKKAIEKKRQKDTETDKIYEFLKKNKNKLKTEFIEKILYDNSFIEDETWWIEEEEHLGIDFSYDYYTPVLCYIDKSEEAIKQYETQNLLHFSIDNVINEILDKHWKNAQVFYIRNKFFIIFPYDTDELNDGSSIVEKILREIHYKISKYLKLTFTTVIGRDYQVRDQLTNSLRELFYNEEQSFYYQHGSINHLEVTPYEKSNSFHNHLELTEELVHFMIKEDYDEVESIVVQQLETMRELRLEPSIVKDWSVKLVLDIKHRLQALPHFEDTTIVSMTDKLVNQAYSLDYLEELMVGICRQLMVHTKDMKHMPENTDVASALKYVQINIHKKITLSEVATHLHLNPSYFSRVFKKVTGETFIEHVIRVKMERAQELLSKTNKSVDEISVDLGYESKSYFLKTFKKSYGVPPSSFRYEKDSFKQET